MNIYRKRCIYDFQFQLQLLSTSKHQVDVVKSRIQIDGMDSPRKYSNCYNCFRELHAATGRSGRLYFEHAQIENNLKFLISWTGNMSARPVIIGLISYIYINKLTTLFLFMLTVKHNLGVLLWCNPFIHLFLQGCTEEFQLHYTGPSLPTPPCSLLTPWPLPCWHDYGQNGNPYTESLLLVDYGSDFNHRAVLSNAAHQYAISSEELIISNLIEWCGGGVISGAVLVI